MKNFALALVFVSGCAAAPAYEVRAEVVEQPPIHPDLRHSREELEQLISHELAGYTPESVAVSGRLETLSTVPLRFQRGRCYLMVFRVGDDARFSPHALRGIKLLYVAPDDTTISGDTIRGPGGIAHGGCPNEDGDFVFDVRASWGNDKNEIHDLGQGPYTLQLYSRPVGKNELEQRAAETKRQVEAQQASQRRECAECAAKARECNSAEQNCQRVYEHCIRRRGLVCDE